MATLPSDVQDQLPEGMEVRIASLTDEGQQQVYDALTEVQNDGAIDEDTFNETVTNAENADYDRSEVEEARANQAEAVETGDLDKAQDYARDAEYELRDIDDLGGNEAGDEVLEAQTDQQELATAQDDADYAQANADFAMSDRGTEGQREVAAETAADYSEDAAQYASQADAGGTDGDHSYSAAANDVPAAEDTAGTEE